MQTFDEIHPGDQQVQTPPRPRSEDTRGVETRPGAIIPRPFLSDRTGSHGPIEFDDLAIKHD